MGVDIVCYIGMGTARLTVGFIILCYLIIYA